MKLNREVLAEMKVKPGESAGLDARSTSTMASDWLGSQDKDRHGEKRKKVPKRTSESSSTNSPQHRSCSGERTYSLLIVLQAMDAAGKDGTIKHVMSGVNPQGCRSRHSSSLRPRSSATISCANARSAARASAPFSIFNRSTTRRAVTRAPRNSLAKTHECRVNGPDEKSGRTATAHQRLRAPPALVARRGSEVFPTTSPREQKKSILTVWSRRRTGSSPLRISPSPTLDEYQRVRGTLSPPRPRGRLYVCPDHKYALRHWSAASSSTHRSDGLKSPKVAEDGQRRSLKSRLTARRIVD